MKKMFLVLLVLCFAGISYGQNTDKSTTNQTEQQIINKVFEKTLELLRVKIISGSVTLSQAQLDSLQKITEFPGAKTYADIRNSWDWARSSTTYIDTVKVNSVAIDTLLIGGTEWSKVTVSGIASTDSLDFAVGTTAPATFHRIFGTTPFVTEKLNKTYFTKVFLKGRGVSGNVRTYQVTIEAF